MPAQPKNFNNMLSTKDPSSIVFTQQNKLSSFSYLLCKSLDDILSETKATQRKRKGRKVETLNSCTCCTSSLGNKNNIEIFLALLSYLVVSLSQRKS